MLFAVLRAKARQMADIVTSDIQPVQNLRIINLVEKMVGPPTGAEKKLEFAATAIRTGLEGERLHVSLHGCVHVLLRCKCGCV